MTTTTTNPALAALRHHVTGAIERGESQAIAGIPAPAAAAPIHARQAIVTRYLCPTNTRPSRIRASCDRASLTIPYPQGESGADAHAVAVRALLSKFHSEDAPDGDFRFRSRPAFERWVCGGMPQASADAYVWVQLPAPEYSPEPPTERRLRDALAEILVAGGANGADVPALLKIAANALTSKEGGAL